MQVEAIGEMQIQATMQIHFTTFTRTRMATSKKKKKIRSTTGEDVEKPEPSYTAVENAK